MSDSNNKENPPSGSNAKYESSCEYSPSASKKALKPISPNKGPNSYVGKLNFLQGDNIDNHFNNIHNSHQQLHQQLHNLEVQTTQTGVDLGQLCDRLKNNNQYLTQLLENITTYSNEVITEGNATKNDIASITKRLDLFNKELKEIRMMEASQSISDNVKRTIREEFSRNPTSTKEEILTEVKAGVSECFKEITRNDINALTKTIEESHSKTNEKHEVLMSKLTQIYERIPDRDLVKRIVDPIVAELKSVSLDSDSQQLLGDIFNIMNREKEVNKATEEFQKRTMEKLESVFVQINTNGSQPTLDELIRRIDDLHQDAQTQNNDILLQLSTGAVQSNELANINSSVVDFKRTLESKDEQISKLMQLVEDQSNSIKELTSKSEKFHAKQNLEKSISSLETKYHLLCKNYQQKYDDFKLLQNDFKTLSDNTKQISAFKCAQNTRKQPDQLAKLANIRQLHNFKMKEIQGNGYSSHMKNSKRVVSTPVALKQSDTSQRFDQISEHNESLNNSDEEF